MMTEGCAIAASLYAEVRRRGFVMNRRDFLQDLAFNDEFFAHWRQLLEAQVSEDVRFALERAEMRVLIKPDVDPYVLCVQYQGTAKISQNDLLPEFLESVLRLAGFTSVAICQVRDRTSNCTTYSEIYRWFWQYDSDSKTWTVG